MSDGPNSKPKEQPRPSEVGQRTANEREARLAAALRANLRRRKAQSRAAAARDGAAAPTRADPKS